MSKLPIRNFALSFILLSVCVFSMNANALPDSCEMWSSRPCDEHGHVLFVQNNSNHIWYVKKVNLISWGYILALSDSHFFPHFLGRIMVDMHLDGHEWAYPNYEVTLTDGSNEVKLSAKVSVPWVGSDSIVATSSNPALITHQLDRRGYSNSKPGASLFVIN